MNEAFSSVIKKLISSGDIAEDLLKLNITDQFLSDDSHGEAPLKRLNAAFLLMLSGRSHPLFDKAASYIEDRKSDPRWTERAEFYLQAVGDIHREIEGACSLDSDLGRRLKELSLLFEDGRAPYDGMETIDRVRTVFFPEGVGVSRNREELIRTLRDRRRIKITRLNPVPITDPAREVLFTSNVLLTLPPEGTDIGSFDIGPSLREHLMDVFREEQLYWYDHPVQIGVEIEKNEVVYGLRGLAEALRFEKQRGTVQASSGLNCILSVSVTHRGLQSCAKEYIEGELRKAKGTEDLKVYIFTEADTTALVEEILAPVARRFLGYDGEALLKGVFGVDGEYGRHYSFLKAVTALWQVFIDPEVGAAFKIDLDQVFPQSELVGETGLSAFEHLKSPLWGAEGLDSDGDPVHLGMLAGALVNERDIGKSIFTPDVGFPSEEIRGDELIFYSTLPQALSTEAEMMTRYDGDPLDGCNCCIQRVHVTGGTTGILIGSLRRYRPFTPTFIGRAEDQAYIMSVLFREPPPYLRYVHKDGLVMRHDKEVFAGEAIKSAALGKTVGDYIRLVWFSLYARALPWPARRTKALLDPFTGCFISPMPFTMAYLRLALKAATFFENRDERGYELLKTGIGRLRKISGVTGGNPGLVKDLYSREKEAWDVYYDALDAVEKALKGNDPFAVKLKKRAEEIVRGTRIEIEA
ncbi:hypothetical protein BMS3Abin08_00515 [bacterium BMS3Abin08]|nr:hypothetical protein BMS3Abin08_00515 [bacterium BMS3Abin08]